MSAVVSYSDNFFKYFEEGLDEQRQSEAGRELDNRYRLAQYILRREGERVLRFARLNGVDLSDTAVQASIVSYAKDVRGDSEHLVIDSQELSWSDGDDWDNEWTTLWDDDEEA